MVQWANFAERSFSSSSDANDHNHHSNHHNSITATVLSIHGITVDTSGVTPEKIKHADFSAVTCQIVFQQTLTQSQHPNLHLMNANQDNVLITKSMKSCPSHPLEAQLSHLQQKDKLLLRSRSKGFHLSNESNGTNLLEAKWYGMSFKSSLAEAKSHHEVQNNKIQLYNQALEDEYDEDDNDFRYREEVKDSNDQYWSIDGSIPGLQYSYNESSTSSFSMNGSHAKQQHNRSDTLSKKKKCTKSFEILVKLIRGKDEILLGCVSKLQIPLYSAKALQKFAETYRGSCQLIANERLDPDDDRCFERYRLELHLPVRSSNNHYDIQTTALGLKKSKSFKKLRSLGRKKRQSSEFINKMFEFSNGDGRKYGISDLGDHSPDGVLVKQYPDSYCTEGCTLHIRLDVVIDVGQPLDEDYSSPSSSSNNRHSIVKRDNEYVHEVQKQDLKSNARQLDETLFEEKHNDFLNNSNDVDALPWRDAQKIQQELHLQHLQKMSRSFSKENGNLQNLNDAILRSDVIFGDVASVITGQASEVPPASENKKQRQKEHWNFHDLFERFTSLGGPCTAACAALNESDSSLDGSIQREDDFQKVRRGTRKIKKRLLTAAKEMHSKIDLPKDEEEMRRRIQKMGIHCGVNGENGFDLDKSNEMNYENLYVPHKYRNFPVSSDSVQEDDVSTLGSIMNSVQVYEETSSKSGDHCIQNKQGKCKDDDEQDGIINILSTDSFRTCSDVFQSVTSNPSDIFDDISIIEDDDSRTISGDENSLVDGMIEI